MSVGGRINRNSKDSRGDGVQKAMVVLTQALKLEWLQIERFFPEC